jgi:cell division septal protein FtsQ
MSPRGAITVTTGSGVSLDFGREHFQERLNRFVALYNSWPPSYRNSLARIDLRYKAAVAVARTGNAMPTELQKGQS